MVITKNFEIISRKFDSSINYSVDEAVDKAKDLKFSNFDESLRQRMQGCSKICCFSYWGCAWTQPAAAT